METQITAPRAKLRGGKLLLFRAAALALSLLAALLAGELLIRAVAPQQLQGQIFEWAPRGYLRNRANSVARNVGGERSVYYRFNAQHLRGGPIGDGRVRVLILGDSFTMGWLIEEQNTFVSKLARRAQAEFGTGAFEFINAATGGWGTAEYLAMLEDSGDSFHPQVVVIFIGIADTLRASLTPLYRLDDPQKLTVRATGYQPPPGSRVKELIKSCPGYLWLWEHSHLVQFLRRCAPREAEYFTMASTTQSAEPAPIDPDDHGIVLNKALFRAIHAWCAQRDIRLFVLTAWPAEQKFTPFFPDRNRINIAFRAQAEPFFREEGIEFFDSGNQIAPVLETDLEKYRIPGDWHPSEAATTLIAETVWPWLEPRLRAAARR
ncbi:MAG: SGNH/GDSL hydrolase family protein [Tepidisphaeraceae bacterium]